MSCLRLQAKQSQLLSVITLYRHTHTHNALLPCECVVTVAAILACDGADSVGRPIAVEDGDSDLLKACSFPARCVAAAWLGVCISGCCDMASLENPLDWGRLDAMDIASCALWTRDQ